VERGPRPSGEEEEEPPLDFSEDEEGGRREVVRLEGSPSSSPLKNSNEAVEPVEIGADEDDEIVVVADSDEAQAA
jgi:hypothetical protein